MAVALAASVGVVAMLSGCGSRTPTPPAAAAAQAAPQAGDAREQLSRLVERYWDKHASTELLAPQSVADALSLERRSLAELASVTWSDLDVRSRQNFDIFKRQREEAVQGFTFPLELLPLDPFGGMALQLAMASADLQTHPLANTAEYDDWLVRIQAYVLWTRQATVNLREGLRRGYTEPKAVVARMLSILQPLGAEESTNVLYAPLRSMPESIKDPDRARLSQTLKRAITLDLLPANRALAAFLQGDYEPHARSTLALSALPLGSAWYAFRLQQATGTQMSAMELHKMGITEVERLHARLPSPRAIVPAAMDPIDGYKQLAVLVRAAMPGAFAQKPTEDFEIRSTVFEDDPGYLLSYHAASASGLAGIVYLRTALPAPLSIPEFLRVAEPGRHYLTALQQLSTLPRFRRATADPAFVAGWQLYAASLGEELGLFTEDSAKQAMLDLELRCAAVMVVDTGIHALGWSRQQALDYLASQLSLTDPDRQALIDLQTVRPADGLGCRIGQLKIQALRSRAQQVLGARFDIRDFHSQILENGPMPLDILDSQVKAWIESAR